MMRVVFTAAAVCASLTSANDQAYHRWSQAQDPCVNIEGGARYCFPSANVCTSTHFGECPKSGTHAEARCTEDSPGYHPSGTYAGRCVLSVDTQCVERESGFVCAYVGQPQARPASIARHVGEPLHAADHAEHAGVPQQGGEQVGIPQQGVEQMGIPQQGDEAVQVGAPQRPVDPVQVVAVKSDAAAVPVKEDAKAESSTIGVTVGIVGVAAVAVVAFVAMRKRNSGQHRDDQPDNLVTPEVPHPDHTAPNLLGSGPLTPSLNAEKSKIFSV